MAASLLIDILRAQVCLLSIVLLPLPWSAANAQNPPAPATASPPAAPAGTTAPAQGADQAKELDCNAPISPIPPAGNRKFVIRIEPDTTWQPRGGEVKISIDGTDFKPDSTPIMACFRWSNAGPTCPGGWCRAAPLKTVKRDAGTVTFAATVPQLPAAPAAWWQRSSETAPGRYTGLFYVIPVADLRVMATSADPIDIVLPVGITSVTLSFLLAIGAVLIAGAVLWRVGKWWGIPGRNAILKIISTQAGYASLSQLQIILWTFVIGASAVYVMALSGNLIDIKTGTLVLLGITGISTLGSKLQSQQQSPPAQAQAVPSTVNGLAIIAPARPTDVQFSWPAPAGGGQPTSYVVQYRKAGPPPGDWVVASNAIADTRITVVGLEPATPYEFRVAGVNAAGSSQWPTNPLTATTEAAPALAAGALGAPTALTATTSTTEPKLTLAWTPPTGGPPQSMYTVRYRLHDGADPWQTSGTTYGTSFIPPGLIPNSLYDFEVTAVAGDVPGRAATAKGKSGPHVPSWSDLVLDPAQGEIDVTRVQMLFFTLIVAGFVTLRVLTSGLIPDIPETFLLLMGISNGVYLTAKFVPH